MGLTIKNGCDQAVWLEKDEDSADIHIMVNDLVVAFFDRDGVLNLVPMDEQERDELKSLDFTENDGQHFVSVCADDGRSFVLED